MRCRPASAALSTRRRLRVRVSVAIAPEAAIGVPPSSVAEVEHPSAMRTPAMLALAFRATEPDQPRQLGPVDRIKPTMFRHDGHDDSMSQCREERKQKIEMRAALAGGGGFVGQVRQSFPIVRGVPHRLKDQRSPQFAPQIGSPAARQAGRSAVL